MEDNLKCSVYLLINRKQAAAGLDEMRVIYEVAVQSDCGGPSAPRDDRVRLLRSEAGGI